MPLAAGLVVNGRYRIIQLLGQGGFGAVYQARDQNLDRFCALKENLETADETSRQFEREARILANLNHPNLPRVIDHFRISDQGQYLVMDFIEGEDLDQRLRRAGRPLPEAEVLHWAIQVCDALAYLHQHNPPIIHRDIKPANIRITPQGKAMLVDFGIAKMYSPSMRTTIGARAVTPGFSPPEQYGTGTTDERSDIYALGATLYALLTGLTPPESIDLMAGNVPALRPAHEVNPAVSPRTSAAIRQAMQPSRLQRYQTAGALCADLRPPAGPQAPHLSPPAPPARVVNQLVGRLGAQPAAGPVPAASGAGVYSNPPSGGRSPVEPAPGSRVIHIPHSKPRRSSSTLLYAALIGGILLLGVVGLVALFRLLNPQAASATPTSALAGQLPPGLATPAVTSAVTSPEIVPTAVPTAAPPATDIPRPQSPPGSVQISLPQARLAFVSDHREDQADRIYTLSIKGGEFWYQPDSGSYYLVGENAAPIPGPYSEITQVQADEDHNMAWWPEWCANDSLILFESQDTKDTGFQTVYWVSSSPFDGNTLQAIRWEGFAKLGVPRCAHLGQTVLVSALSNAPGATWELYSFNLDNPGQGQRVHDGFPFAGNADWSGDDRWIAFMHRNLDEKVFSLLRLDWSAPASFTLLPRWSDVADAKYPAVSPITGEIAFACSDTVNWNLCLADGDGQDMRVALKGLARVNATSRAKPRAAVPAVTPRWSPDGRWIAFSSKQDGDWDIYLFNPGLNVSLNLTQGLPGDQFQPAWSRH